MQSDTDLDILLDYQSAKVRELLQAAYEAGRVAGRREAAKQIQVQLSGWMGNVAQLPQAAQETAPAASSSQAPVIEDGIPPPTARAPKGAIRAALLETLRNGSAKLDEIVARTGHNANSVRSTLYLLRSEGVAVRTDDLWSLTKADDGTLGAGAPTPDEVDVEHSPADETRASDDSAVSNDAAGHDHLI